MMRTAIEAVDGDTAKDADEGVAGGMGDDDDEEDGLDVDETARYGGGDDQSARADGDGGDSCGFP
jgi:hypothetical protein